jgi:YidC/Oxa1 family membrane protein insertase
LDQRRFFSFLLISLAVFLLSNQLFPPPPRPKDQPAAAAAKGVKGKADQKGAAPAGDAKKNGKAETEKPQPAVQPGEVPAVAAASTPVRYAALGSLDPNSGYRMLVTLTSSGAAVLRAEMTNSRYRDQHDWSGYLGDLELKKVPGGIQAQVVGAGTPAANAKIEAGDVIVGIGNPQTAAINSMDDLTVALAKSKPDQEITLQVRRAGNALEPRKVQLMRRPFAIVRPEIENYQMREINPPADFVDRPSFLLTLSELNGNPLSKVDAKRVADVLETGNWELTAHDEKSATFRRTLPELKLEIFKRYTLAIAPPDEVKNADYRAYHLQLEVEMRNTAGAAVTAAYRLDGATGMPMEGWWYARRVSRNWGGGSLRAVDLRFVGSSTAEFDGPNIAKGKVDPMGDGQTLAYAGVDSQYFSAVLIPKLSALDDNWFTTTEAIISGPKPEANATYYANVTSRMTRKPIALEPGATQRDSYDVFLGPKRPDLLSEYYPKSAKWEGDPNYSLKDLNYFGWFGSVAQIMLAILHFLYSIVRNYGVAIILLTVIVRGLMFPISYKQTQNMARIQALKPEIDRINEKYKGDVQKKSQANQELYRKHNINPLGGCLPLFLQMPIFVGLYRALMVDVELRQSPLFGSAIHWCSNLAAPDMLLDWSAVMPTFFTQGPLGPYLNILPIVTVTVMLITQKMSMPPPANEQAAMQQKMMKYMMIFFALMFYKVASGLCLYLIVSSLWGIAERKLLPKAITAGAGASGGESGTGPGGSARRPSGNGPNGSGGSKRPRKVKRKK